MRTFYGAGTMSKFRIGVIALAIMLAACGPQAAEKSAATPVATESATTVASGARPETVGACVDAVVTLVGPRLEGAPESGSTIQYANGVSQVEYDAVPGIDHSRVGDSVHLCLVSVPQNCPPGDNRGRVYSGTNTRTHESWSAPDSEHQCGGA